MTGWQRDEVSLSLLVETGKRCEGCEAQNTLRRSPQPVYRTARGRGRISALLATRRPAPHAREPGKVSRGPARWSGRALEIAVQTGRRTARRDQDTTRRPARGSRP